MQSATVNFFTILNAITAAVSDSAVIDSNLRSRFFSGETQNVMVTFSESIDKVFDQNNGLRFSSSDEKRTALTNAQKIFSDGVQKPLQTLLSTMGVNYETFWISNTMIIPNVDSALVQSISSIPGVAKIEEEPVIRRTHPSDEDAQEQGSENADGEFGPNAAPAWGVQRIRANLVWKLYNGTGIVVAGIDSGVRYTHEALKARWRTTYGWFDAFKGSSTPNDQDGHGTHTMATIAGSQGVGVAPGATWIACKGCFNNLCPATQVLKCGQWIQCPTNPDGTGKNCTMAPHVVSNSWGYPGGQTWYNKVISSWQTAGIIPIFAAGNEGPACSTMASPGDQDQLIAVGSTDSIDRIWSLSSLGPTITGKVKPDISAPGSIIRSAWHTGDKAYRVNSGTSMACPHVSGVVALLLQKKKSLTYAQIYSALTSTAVRNTLNKSNAKTCGGKTPQSFPNNVFGYGRVDAVKALKAV